MRELKDHFCNAEQSKELIELGFDGSVLAVHLGSNLRQVPLAYNLNPHETKAPLRSQALDFFRDLGYRLTIHQNEKGHWYEIQMHDTIRIQPDWHKYSVCESALIDWLIELEKEARNGKQNSSSANHWSAVKHFVGGSIEYVTNTFELAKGLYHAIQQPSKPCTYNSPLSK